MRRISLWMSVAVCFVLPLDDCRLSADSAGVTSGSERAIFRKVITALRRFETVKSVSSYDVFVYGGNGKQTASASGVLVVKRDGISEFFSLLNSGSLVGGRSWGYKHEYRVRPDGSVLFCQADLENPIDVTSEAIDPRMVLNSMEVAGVQKTDREEIERELNEISIAVWSLGYCSIRQMLETARTIAIESAGPKASIVSTCDWGRLSLDVSERSGWLPERFEVAKGLDDLTVNGTVREVYDERCDSVVFHGYASGFSDQHSGFPVPDHFEVIRVEQFKNGEESRMKTSVHHDEIVFGEALVESDLEFTIDLPPGLPVTVAGALQLPYEWNGKDAVPSVPGLSALQRNERFGSSGFWILIVIHVVLILVLLTVVVRKKKHA